ncbi:hypothetical protein NP493_1440g00000 [Ridgeia piscesae]|uniref:Prefoldin subunit 5 n=1 Tax=Ridgeia piscesae TaxID=27915 RepID=A0AAD9K3W9_RIDPI|nr:hypothetical protein NP493_1440g00000 [Ridgeia piscesae]
MSQNSGKEIPLTELNVGQLNHLSQQLDQEIELMQNSLNQLKMVQSKFVESQECLGKVTKANVGKDMLVPLTSSMYVTGQLDDTDNFLIDVGTGYYVEKNAEQGKEYFKRKVEYITKEMEKIQPLLQEKYKMKQAVVEVVQMKVQAQMSQQQQPGQQPVPIKS